MASNPAMCFLALCRPSADGSNRDLIRNFPAPDWSTLVSLARWHGMIPLLASYLLSSGRSLRPDAPAFVLEALRSHKERHFFRSLSQTAALIELQREFDRADLRILSWKGPSVGILLYGSATLRESVDLDFLFFKEDIQKVLKITRSLGYRLLQSSDSESKDIYVLAAQREFTFHREKDQVVLEFHLQMLPARFLLWQDARGDIGRASTACALANTELLIQSPEDLLVGLCAHATKHNWNRLKWSCDIAQFLDVYGDKIDWPRFLSGLRKERKHFVVLLGLALAANLFDLLLPSVVTESLQQNPKVATLAKDIADHLMSGSTEPLEIRHRRLIVETLCPRLRDRIVYTLRPILELNYEDLYIPVYNRQFFFMNYVLRVVRLVRKYGLQRLATKTATSVRSVH